MKNVFLLFILALIVTNCSSQSKEVSVLHVQQDTIFLHDTIKQVVKHNVQFKKVEDLSLYDYGHSKKKLFANCAIYQLPNVQICIITLQDSIFLVCEASFVDGDENARNYRLKDLASILLFKNKIVIEYDEEVEGTKTHTIMGGIPATDEN